MKKILVLIAVLILTIPFGVTIAYADEPKVYKYSDESAMVEYTLESETEYSAKAINLETEDLITISGTYTIENDIITFYLANEVLFKGQIGEDNILIEVEEEILEDTLLDEEEKQVKRIVEYIISGVLGLLGTSAVAIAFRGSLKGLGLSVKSVLGKIKEDKALAEEDIKALKKEVKTTLASLEKVRTEVVNSNKEEFKAMETQIVLLKKVITLLASGTKELVENGTAECIVNLLGKEVNGNGEEV